MKILHVRDVASVASTLVDALNAQGHQAELMQPHDAGAKYPLAIKALFLPRRLTEGAAINRYIKSHDFDVVHLHFAYMGMMGLAGGYEYFLHCHGHDLDVNLRQPFLRWATIRSLRGARRVYYSTPDLSAYARQFRPDAVFIPNPINIDNFRPLSDGASSSGPPRVLLISRLWDRKGIDVAIEIVRQFKLQMPEATIEGFRWGPELPRYGGLPEMNLISTVPYSEMPALINRYDIVIGQFKLGIMSMSELESMACGKPVVSFFKFPEFYDEPPPLFSTRDVNQAVEHLITLCENPEMRREAGERGREWVVRRHDYHKIARTLVEEYETYATRKPATKAS